MSQGNSKIPSKKGAKMLAVFGGILEFGWMLARLGILEFDWMLALGAASFVLWAISELIKAF